MEVETTGTKMGMFLMESGRRITEMERELCSIIMVLFIKVVGIKENSREEESSISAMGTPMTDSGFAARCMGRECWLDRVRR